MGASASCVDNTLRDTLVVESVDLRKLGLLEHDWKEVANTPSRGQSRPPTA